MEWEEVRDENDRPPIVRWATTTPGTPIEGTKSETLVGKFGPLVTIATDTGEIVVPVPSALRARMEVVPEGARIKLTYLGLKESAGGRSFHDFVLHMAKELPPIKGHSRRPAS